MRPPQCEPGLADSTRAADGPDQHGRATAGLFIHELVELGQFGPASNKRTWWRWQLTGYRQVARPTVAGDHSAGWRGQRGIVRQDLVVHQLQRRARVGAKVVGQTLPDPPVCL